mgnify:CR=1 FL=1
MDFLTLDRDSFTYGVSQPVAPLVRRVIAENPSKFTYHGTGTYIIETPRNREEQWLLDTVRELADEAGIGMPEVAVFDSPQPNAFATGRNPENAAVAATTGLLRRLSREEVAGVMAHELAHIRNRDTLLMTVTATLAAAAGEAVEARRLQLAQHLQFAGC